MNLNEFAKECHQLSRDKGWYDDRDLTDPDVQHCMRGLIISELAEALECVRSGDVKADYEEVPAPFGMSGVPDFLKKPVGLPSELADVVIRCLDFSEAYPNLQIEYSLPRLYVTECTPTRIGAAIYRAMKTVTLINLSWVVDICYGIAKAYGIDLDAAILEKHAFNKTRPHRHGGKSL
jgi:hypothetical protein